MIERIEWNDREWRALEELYLIFQGRNSWCNPFKGRARQYCYHTGQNA